jgi:hypothetical protein
LRLDSDGLGTATQLAAPDVKHMISEVKLHSQGPAKPARLRR